MSYAAGEAAAKTIIEGATGLSAAQVVSVSNNDPAGGAHVLDRGVNDTIVMLSQGSFQMERTTLRDERYTWQTYIDIWQRWRKSAGSDKELVTTMQAIVDVFPECSTLGLSNVFDARIVSGNEPIQAEDQTQRLIYLQQRLILQWKEDI